MKPHVAIRHDYALANPVLVHAWEIRKFPHLTIELFHDQLATQLGLNQSDLLALIAAGGHALAYAGHQFGQFVPRLGDGRAVLLGELETADGMVDIHVKGTGRTPFSRNGDGLCPLSAAKKEYLFSLALEALGIPTTKVLAVITTGESVQRQIVEPSALVVRVAASHIRVGTFQYAALAGEKVLNRLTDYTISRHYPNLSYSEFFREVMHQQAKTVAEWMRLGFVHGVLNTDNTTVSGESIDFGPCAWAESFRPGTVFSSIDATGRYRFGHQPEIIGWNLARLVECLVPAIGLAEAQKLINDYPRSYQHAWQQAAAQGLGFPQASPAIVELIDDLYTWLQQSGWDTATTFRLLAEDQAPDSTDPQWQLWCARFNALEPDRELMLNRNPVYVPRNHLVAEALADDTVFSELLTALAKPFKQQSTAALNLTTPSSPKFLAGFRTFCGT